MTLVTLVAVPEDGPHRSEVPSRGCVGSSPRPGCLPGEWQ